MRCILAEVRCEENRAVPEEVSNSGHQAIANTRRRRPSRPNPAVKEKVLHYSSTRPAGAVRLPLSSFRIALADVFRASHDANRRSPDSGQPTGAGSGNN